MINEWYYQRNGEEIGPVPFEQIKELAQGGSLSPEDQIRDAVSGILLPAKSIGGLFPSQQLGTSSVNSASNITRRPEQKTRQPSSTRRRKHDDIVKPRNGSSRQPDAARKPAARPRNPTKKSVGMYESPSSSTRENASRISEYANNLPESTAPQVSFWQEIREHPIKIIILLICISGAVYKFLPEKYYGEIYYEEFNKIYAEMGELRAAGVTGDEWNAFTERSKGELDSMMYNLMIKEKRHQSEKHLVNIGQKLFEMFEIEGTVSKSREDSFAKSMHEVRLHIEEEAR